MVASLASVFLPVRSTAESAAWYQNHLGLVPSDVQEHAAVLEDAAGRRLTLLGPASGVAARPGLPWAPVSFSVTDLGAFVEGCRAAGIAPSPVAGDPAVCLFVTVEDSDGNTLLVVDR